MPGLPDKTACERVLERLEAYVDGEVDGGEAKDVAHHLETCAGCSREHELARRVRDELRRLPMLDPPVVVMERHAGRRWTMGALRPRRVLATAAVLLVATIAGTVWFSLRGAPHQDAAAARAAAEARYALSLVRVVGRRVELQELVHDRIIVPAIRGVERPLHELSTALSASDGPQSHSNFGGES